MTEIIYVSPDTEGGQSRDVWYIITQIDECPSKMKSNKYYSFERTTFCLSIKGLTLYQLS